jgi:DNA sulfur modification protein DndD
VILFERLELANFASYRGRHSIDLRTSDSQPVVVVIGSNGFGKSSLFDALNWALYGSGYERDLREKRQRDIADYVHEDALREAASSNEFAEMSATIYFNQDGERYYITQELRTRPQLDESKRIQLGKVERITQMYKVGRDGNHQALPYSFQVLDRSLPNNVRDYFLFDGDRIHSLSQPGSSQQVRDALRRVVDLDLLAETRDDVAAVAREFGREAGKASTGQLATVEGQLQDAHEEHLRTSDGLGQLKAEHGALKDQIAKLEQRLSQFSESKPLQEKRAGFERLLVQLEDQKLATLNAMKRNISVGLLSLSSTAAVDLLGKLDELREAGQIPSRISQQLLKDLLELERCLCDTSLAPDTEARTRIEERLRTELGRTNREELLDVFYSLQNASRNIEDALSEVREQDESVDQIVEKIRVTDIALREVESELRNLPQGDIAALERERADRNDKLISNVRQQERATTQLETMGKRITELESTRAQLNVTQHDARKAAVREQLAEKAASVLDSIYQKFSDDSRISVERMTQERFGAFVESAANYSVQMTDDYALQVKDSNGNPALQRLSMGQQQCLGLSFITAVSDVSEKNPPLVIDMPFGRLDGTVDFAVASALTTLTHQLILFLLPDREWTESIQSAFRGKVSHIYDLEFDAVKRETSISDCGEY